MLTTGDPPPLVKSLKKLRLASTRLERIELIAWALSPKAAPGWVPINQLQRHHLYGWAMNSINMTYKEDIAKFFIHAILCYPSQ